MTIIIPTSAPADGDNPAATTPAALVASRGWTKGEIITAAFGELTLTDDAGFDITPGEKANALRRLDTMIATWAAKGVRVGYNFPQSPIASSVNDDAGIPDSAVETVYLNLARRMAPGFGKQLSAETLKNARDGYDTLLWNSAHPIEQQLPHTTPRGAGNKPWRTINRNFSPRPNTDPLRFDDQSGELTILQE